MRAIIKIAWRNVWRNRLRSAIIIVSLVLGIWSGLSIMSFAFGMNDQRLRTAINTYLAHVQIHDSAYLEDFGIKHTINEPDALLKEISSESHVKGWTARNVVNGTVNTARGSAPVQIKGIDPEQEISVMTLKDNLTQGTYFEKYKRNPILIGEKLAEKLNLEIKDKPVVQFQTYEGDLSSVKFKIEGIYRSGNSANDLMTIYARKADVDRIAGLNGQIHEILLLGDHLESSDSLKAIALGWPGGNTTETWAEVAPELGYANEIMGVYIYIFMGIILLALAFGIINTMLMAVLERKRELGMLLSVGMNRMKVFRMFIYETIFFSLVATPLGMLLSYLTINHFNKAGIDLSIVGEGMENFGMSTMVYPYLENQYYFTITIMTLAVAFVASLIPAYRAMRTVPAEAVKAI